MVVRDARHVRGGRGAAREGDVKRMQRETYTAPNRFQGISVSVLTGRGCDAPSCPETKPVTKKPSSLLLPEAASLERGACLPPPKTAFWR